MIERNQVYRCAVCGNVVTVMHAGGGQLVCCNQPMAQMTENTVDASTEKHVPVVERIPDGIRVTVGSVEHPMEEAHYIMWIEAIAGGRRYVRFLSPGERPEAEFPVTEEEILVREYCNLHGLWRA